MSHPPSANGSILARPDVQATLAGMRPRTINSAIFNIAHAYARAADSAWQSLDSTRDADFGGPAIICQTFAIELLLKFFIVAEHADATDETVFANLQLDLRGHRCVTLFERLSSDSRSMLEMAFATRRSPTMPASLRDALAALGDDPFFKWRYVYEGSRPLEMDKALLDSVTDTLGASAALTRQRLEGMRQP